MLARTTIAIAFQRMIERRRRSIAGSPGICRLAVGRDRVDVRRVQARDRAGAGVLGALDDAGQELAGAVRAVVLDDGVERLEPLARLDRVDVGSGAVRVEIRGLGQSYPAAESLGSAVRSAHYTPARSPERGVPCSWRDRARPPEVACSRVRYVPLMALRAARWPARRALGARRSPGALDQLVVESELLAGNPLGDPARRPLYVYRSPGVAAAPAPDVPLRVRDPGLHRPARHVARPRPRSSRR